MSAAKSVFFSFAPENLSLALVLLLLHQVGLQVEHAPRELAVDHNVGVQQAHSL